MNLITSFKLNTMRSKILFFTVFVVFMATISVEFLMLRFHGDTILNSTLNLAVSKTEFVASNSAGVVVFNDQESMKALFDNIKTDPHVLKIDIYQYNSADKDITLFSSYKLDGIPDISTHIELLNKETLSEDYIEIFRIIIVSEKPVGLAVLYYDTTALKEYRQQTFGILLLGLLIASLVTFAISGLLLRRFTHPIDSLVESTRNIASSQDYSVRVEKISKDEMGELADNFNKMMEVIYTKDEQQRLKEIEIIKLNENLEVRVKERTSELETAKEKAEAASEEKAAFLANMSHEIRTPMNSVIGYLEIVLEKSDLEKGIRENINTSYKSAHNLLNIINDILTISKLNIGKMELESHEFILLKELREVLDALEVKAKENGLKLNLRINEQLSICYRGDSSRLRQVLLNLVGNSIKFTHTGSVTVDISPTEQDNVLHFSIIDTGIGIPKERLGSIFKSFIQADTSTTRKYGGTGLGLTISQQIIELMGGKVWVESKENVGTTFHFTIRLEPVSGDHRIESEDDTEKSELPMSPRSFRVLLAEDIPENYKLAQLRLEEQNHLVTIAVNGALAVESVQNNDFDIILMDVHMPEMDGLEATRRIRAMEKGTDKHIAIVALTASLLKEELSLCIEAGMDDVTGKPIDLAELYAKMERVVPAGRGKINITQPVLTNGDDDIDLSCLQSVADLPRALRVWRNKKDYSTNLHSFVERQSNVLTRLSETIESDDLTEARNLVHTLKGVAGNLALIDLQNACRQLSSSLKSGKKQQIMKILLTVGSKLAKVRAAVMMLSSTATISRASEPCDFPTINRLTQQLNVALDSGEVPAVLIDALLEKLRGNIDAKSLDELTDAINQFDFDLAKKLLDQCINLLTEKTRDQL